MEETCKTPVAAFDGGIGYRFLAGSSARFPWNDMSRPDVQEEIVFQIEPKEHWGGDEMGIRICEAIQEFLDGGKRASGPSRTVIVSKETCRHGNHYRFSRVAPGNLPLVSLFELEPGPAWKGDELAYYIAQRLEDLAVLHGQ